MIGFPVMRILALALALSCGAFGVASPSLAQAPASAPAAVDPAGQVAYATPQAAVESLADAVRRDDVGLMRKVFGDDYRSLVPTDATDGAVLRKTFIEAYDKGRKVNMDGDAKAVLEVGDKGWTFPVPLAKRADGWRFDIVAGAEEIMHREIGRNELAVMQVLLAIVDAQQEYFIADPMKTGTPRYARRLLSTPGKKDGLYWEGKPGEPESPLGDLVAHAQSDGAKRAEGYHGYNFRLLYSQGPNAPGGAYDYLVKDRMIGGFAVVAWPVRYGETGVMTFVVSHYGVVYEKDLGPDTPAAAGRIVAFDPDKSWTKSDTTP